MPAPQHQVGECSPIFLAVAGLAEEAEVAVGGFAQVLCRYRRRALQRLGDGLLTGRAPPGLDHMPDEVDASINGLEDRLRRVEPGAQAWKELLDLEQPFIELLRRVMQQHEVVDVADVMLHAERVLAELVQGVEVDVRD